MKRVSRRNGENATIARSASIDRTSTDVDGSPSEEQAVCRVRGLAHTAVILELLERRRAERMRQEKPHHQTSQTAHLIANGHELRFGCCRVPTAEIAGEAA